MGDIKCKVVQAPDGYSVINMTGAKESARVFGGSFGNTNYLCGSCDQILGRKLQKGKSGELVLNAKNLDRLT